MYQGKCIMCGKRFSKVEVGNPCLCPACEEEIKNENNEQLLPPFAAPVKEVKEPNFLPTEEVFIKKVKRTPAVGTDGG